MVKNKPCFILIRGLLREQRHWGDFIQLLQNRFPSATLIALDIPGNGIFHRLTSPNNIADLTDALRQQLSTRVELNLIALSMGGMIAIDWMTRYPSEIKSAVLINSSVRPYSPFYHRLRWKVYPAIIRMFFSSSDRMEEHILSITSNYHNGNTKLLQQWLQWRRQNPVSNASALNQLLAAAKFSAQTKPQQPLLIVTAKNDRLVDYRCSLRLHQAWHTEYQQHDKAGHDLPLDVPQWLAEIIYSWKSAF